MRYLGLRVLQSIFVMLGVSLLSFVFVELAPGNFFDEMRLDPRISSSTLRNLRKQYGMDRPLPVRYSRWLESTAKGELGFSFAYNAPVGPLIWARARNTLLLTGSATLLAWLIALPLGILSVGAATGVDRSCLRSVHHGFAGYSRFAAGVGASVPGSPLPLAPCGRHVFARIGRARFMGTVEGSGCSHGVVCGSVFAPVPFILLILGVLDTCMPC